MDHGRDVDVLTDARARNGVLVGEQDDVADGTEGRGSGYEGRALVEALGEQGDGEGREEGEGVGRDGEELCGGGRVA